MNQSFPSTPENFICGSLALIKYLTKPAEVGYVSFLIESRPVDRNMQLRASESECGYTGPFNKEVSKRQRVVHNMPRQCRSRTFGSPIQVAAIGTKEMTNF